MANFLIHRGNQVIDLQGYNPFITITKAEYIQNILTQDLISMNLVSNTALEFFLGDYIIHHDRKFTINQNPVIKKINESRYEYTIEFEGVQYDLLRRVFFNYDTQGIFTDCDFSFTGTINDFAQLIVNNANRNSDIVWNLGFITPNEDVKTLSFSNSNTLSALQTIVQEYDTEFFITQDLENNTFTININRVESNDIVFSLSYGFRRGLYSLERTNVSEGQITTRLYAFGSTENLPRGYRDYSTRLKMPISVGDYIQSQEKIDLYGVSEEVVLFDDIKPSFEGVMSSVVNTSTEDSNLFEFICSTIDFDLNEVDEQGQTKYLIAGTPASISIKTGNLAGYEFEIHKYNHDTNKFLVKKLEDERGQFFPDDSTSAFMFQNGDKFTLFNIVMPESYVIEAEQKLHEKAVIEYEKKSMVNISYVLDIDENFLRTYGDDETEMLKIGDLIEVDDIPLNITQTSRITSLTRDLLKPQKYKAEIADTYEFSITQQVVQDINDIETTIRTDKLKSKQLMHSGYRRMRELQGLIFDTDGYFDSELIKPYSIETQMLSVGARSQQFTLEDVVFTANYSNNPNRLKCSAGKLIHFNLGDSVREFNISELITTLATNEPYYVYVRINQETNLASWRVTTDKIKFDSELGYYNFLCMVLHEPNNGVRLKSMLYGSSFIQGREITTGKIQSIDGNTYFDLDNGEFKGKFTFTNGENVEDAITNQEIYIEYSQNGIDWHSTFLNDDVFMRQKKGDGAWTTPIRIVGVQGIKGDKGADGQTQYVHIRYSANSDGSSMTTTPQANTAYIGIVTTTSSVAPTSNTSYTWAKFKGEQGAQGVQGIKGADGSSLFTWVKYADTPTSGMSDYPDDKLYIGLAYNKVTATESDNYEDYSWSLMPQNIQIGGRNLILNSKEEWRLFVGGGYGMAVLGQTDAKVGETFTASVFVRNSTSPNGINLEAHEMDATGQRLKSYASHVVNDKVELTTTIQHPDTKYVSINLCFNGHYSQPYQYEYSKEKLERGNKATDWTPALEDVEANILQSKQDSINASKAYSDAQDELKRIQVEAYADGKVTAAEQRAIDDATAKAEAAKLYANAQDNLLRVQLEAYADGQITAEEQQRIQQMQENLAAAKAYADAQAELAKITALAYADGIVDEEEARAIADATAKMESAKAHAQGLVNNIQIGGRNLLIKSKLIPGYIYPDDGRLIQWSTFMYNPDYISIGNNKNITFKHHKNNGVTNVKAGFCIVFYDENKSFLSGSYKWDFDENQEIIKVIPSEAKYFRYTVTNINFDSKYEFGNKATDWTPAPEDVDNAINDVRTKAENALTQLTSIANDNILSPSEKQQVANEWNRIKSEYTSNYSLGISNGVDTTNLTNAYNDLFNYINPLLVNLSVESSIVGDVFRTKFKAYYDQNISLLVAINDKIKQGINNNASNINNLSNSIARINQITSFLNTTVNGNVVATGVVLVGEGNEGTGGMSGIRDQGQESIFLYSGQTFNNRYSAPFRVTHGGSVVMTNAYVSGHVTATSGTFSGRIEANSGYIGGLTLQDKILTTTDVNSGIWFTYENDDYKSSIRIGNNIGTGILPNQNYYPFLMIQNQAKKAVTPWESYKAGIYLDMKSYNDEFLSYPAIEVKNGHYQGLSFNPETYLNRQTISNDTDFVMSVRMSGGSYGQPEIFLPTKPRVGKFIIFTNPHDEVPSVKVNGNGNRIGKNPADSSTTTTYNRNMMIIYSGAMWLVLNKE